MTQETVGIALGVTRLLNLFDESYYTSLAGGILESFGRLFKGDLKLFVYPSLNPKTGEITTVETLEVPKPLKNLYAYLAERGSFVHLNNYNPQLLNIFPRDVLKSLSEGSKDWESMVPAETVSIVKERGLFGYRRPVG
jgi:hypothetical protein